MVSIRALEACGPGSNPGSLTNGSIRAAILPVTVGSSQEQ
jgi:hypothetical protein